jgi:hypothetical protein
VKGNKMKPRLLLSILISLFIVSIISVGLVSAKSSNAGQNGNQAIPKRPTDLEQIVFVHQFKPGKPENPGNSQGRPPRDTASYKLWGGKLGETASYKINISGSGVGEAAIDAINAAAGSWNKVTAFGELLSYGGTTTKSGYAYDYENTVSWANLGPNNTNTIAIAYYWYSRKTKEVVEFDIIFNTIWTWGIDPDGEGGKTISDMDIQNLATHEFGHPIGLSDLYTDSANSLTMYGYSDYGETQKRSLEAGDIAGAQALYGGL